MKYNPISKELFKISRSKIELFIQCPRCFYLDQRLDIKRPASFPFNLNNAVDTLLKKEFDIYRNTNSQHPLQNIYKIDAMPFKHELLDTWRNQFKGITYHHLKTNLIIFGGIDDLWINPKEELIIVDYKATAKNSEINLDANWQNSYKRQVEIYQWLFRMNNFKVSDIAYFVYCNGKTDKEAFDSKLEFDIKVIPYIGKTDWIEEMLLKIKKMLVSNTIPKASKTCEFCSYRKSAYNLEKL